MALSTPISLTSVRDFFGLTGNINLTNLHRGESNIINVASTYGSSTVGLGSSITTPVGSIASGSNYMVNGGNHTVSAHADVAINAAILTALSATGTYFVTYYVTAASGNNTILVGATAILT